MVQVYQREWQRGRLHNFYQALEAATFRLPSSEDRATQNLSRRWHQASQIQGLEQGLVRLGRTPFLVSESTCSTSTGAALGNRCH